MQCVANGNVCHMSFTTDMSSFVLIVTPVREDVFVRDFLFYLWHLIFFSSRQLRLVPLLLSMLCRDFSLILFITCKKLSLIYVLLFKME